MKKYTVTKLSVATFLMITCITVASLAQTNCYYDGIPLYGKVQVVTSFPYLKVQAVNDFPNSCGKWQFGNSFPDFTIQFVNKFPDIRIQMANSFPGK